MLKKSIRITTVSSLLAFGLLLMPAMPANAEEKTAAPAPPPVKSTMAKICSNCHNPQPGSLRGNFDSVAYKTHSMQIRIDDSVEILGFDKALKVANVKGENAEEPLRDIKKGKEVRIEYTEQNGKKTATAVIAKPPIKISPEKLLGTADVEKLVAQGPEKGKYLLVDARPAPRFMEGAIPTAINIPFPAFEKMIDKLPKDKSALVVYYCAGVT